MTQSSLPDDGVLGFAYHLLDRLTEIKLLAGRMRQQFVVTTPEHALIDEQLRLLIAEIDAAAETAHALRQAASAAQDQQHGPELRCA
jgi:hypothetical protein